MLKKFLHYPVLLVFCLALLAGTAVMAANPVTYKGLNWQVGQWAQYEMNMDKRTFIVKYSITGTETVNGKTWFWYENEIIMPETKTISKMLILPGEASPKHLYVKNGNEPAMDMTSMLTHQSAGQENNTLQKDEDIVKGFIGYESITVPAGPFNTLHSKVQSQSGGDKTDVWVSNKVPITGVVKLSGKDKRASVLTMKLLKYGLSGAQTSIKEKPQAFKMPQIPNMQNYKSLPKMDE